MTFPTDAELDELSKRPDMQTAEHRYLLYAALDRNRLDAKFDQLVDAAEKRGRELEAELETVRARITTIADESSGPHPVQSIEESLACIERTLFEQRRDCENLEVKLAIARKLIEGVVSVEGTDMAYLVDPEEWRTQRKALET